MIRRLAALVCLALSLTLAAGRANADTGPDAPPANGDARQEARQRFLRGIELAQNGQWDAALAEFSASVELFPTSVALKNAAIALRQLHRNAEALETYERLQSSFGDKLDAQDQKLVADAVRQLRQSVGSLTVTSTPAGATIVVDGLERGLTPRPAPLRLDAGRHTVRVFLQGYEPFEAQLLLASGQNKSVDAKLVALARSGTLRVEEAAGAKLSVLVDGAVVGETPWNGRLSVGVHSVALRGEGDMGAPPSSAEIQPNQTTTLRLSATRLDATVRVDPTPTSARVDVDGVTVGNGVWEGKLRSGKHQVEVTAEGFLAWRREVSVRSGQRDVLRVALERDLSNPMWRESFFEPHLYLEALGGPALARSFAGGADAACSDAGCSDRSRPFGFLVGARGGYQLTSGLGLELFLGYLSLSESVTRQKSASGDFPSTATAFEDTTKLRGPAAALSASYQFFERTPLLFRVWLGAARAKADFSGSGTFRGRATTVATGGQTLTYDFAEPVDIPEQSPSLWVPFTGPEVRIGYRVSKRFAVDAGVAMFVMFAPTTARVGTSDRDRAKNERSQQLPDVPNAFSDGSTARLGLLRLGPDDGFGTFLTVVPSVAARLDF